MASEAAKLFVTVGADVDQAVKGLGSVDGKLKGIASRAGITGAAMTAGLTAPLLLAGKSALSMAMDYQANMNMVQAVSGATADQMAALGDKAKQLGADVTLPGTSAADAATAMLELSKAGLSVNDVLGASQGVLQLSAAGQLDNATAAEITANALNAFGLSGDKANMVADQLAATANASSSEVSDLAQGMQMAAAVFSSAGVPIDALNTSLGLLANNGIKGSDAGTSLKQMLLSLQAPTDKAKGLMNDLGLQVYDSSGKMKDWRSIIGNLGDSMSGLTQEQRDSALATIFGSDAVRAANILLKEGVDGYDAMNTAVNKQGAAADLAGAQMKGLRGSIEGFKSSLETAMLNAVLPFLGTGENLVRWLIGAVDWFDSLSPSVKNAALAFLGILAAAGPVLLIVAGVAAALAFLMTPIGLIVVGLALLGAAFAGNFGGIRDTVMPVLSQFGQFLTGVALPALIAFGQAAATWIQGTLIPAFQSFLAAVLPLLSQFSNWFVGVALPAIVAFGQAAAAWITGTLLPAFSQFVATVLPLLQQFGDFFVSEILPRIQLFVAQAVAFITGTLVPAIQNFVNAALPILERFAAWFIGVALPQIQQFVTLFLGYWDQISAQLFPTLDAIVGYISVALSAIVGFIQTHGDTIMAILTIAWNVIYGIVQATLALVAGIITATMQLIQGDWSGAWDTIKQSLQTAWDAMKGIVTNSKDAVLKIVGDLINALKGLFSGAIGWLKQAGADIIQGLLNGLDSMKDAVIEKAKGIANSVKDTIKGALHIGSPSKDTEELGKWAAAGLALGIDKGASEAATAAANMVKSVIDAMRAALNFNKEFSAASADGITAVPLAMVRQLGQTGKAIVAQLASIVPLYDKDMRDGISQIAGAIKAAADGLTSVMQFAQALSASALTASGINLSGDLTNALVSLATGLLQGFRAAQSQIGGDALASAKAAADGVKAIIDVFKGGLDYASAAVQFVIANGNANLAGKLTEGLTLMVVSLIQAFQDASAKLGTDGIKAAQTFAETVTPVLNAAKSAAETSNTISTMARLTKGQMDVFLSNVQLIFAAIKAAADWSDPALEEATHFREQAEAILAQVQAAVAALAKADALRASSGAGGAAVAGKGVPAMASGGIVTKPTLALIGEGSQPEAVVPLSKMGQFTGGDIGPGGRGNGGINVEVHVYGSVGVDDIAEKLVATLKRQGIR